MLSKTQALLPSLLVAILTFSPLANASDRAIKGAIADITRFEQQAASFTPQKKSSIRRTLKLMSLTRQRLDSSSNQNDAQWQAADQRFKSLEQRLNAMLSDPPAKNPAANKSATGQQPPARSSTATATGKLAGKTLVSGQRVQLKKLARDITNVNADLVRQGPSPMQDGRVVQKYSQRLKQFANALGRYKGYQKDPSIGTAVQAYQTLVTDLKQEHARAKAQLAKVGNAQQRLQTVDQQLREAPVPSQLLIPFSDKQAMQWVQQIENTRKAAQATMTEIKVIAPLAYLPADARYSAQKVNSLYRWAQDSIGQSNEVIKSMRAQLMHRFSFAEKHELPFFRKLDPNNPKHKANMFLREGAEADVYERLDQQLAMAQSFAAFEMAVTGKPDAKARARIAEVKRLRKQYDQNRQQALGDSKLPAPKSEDAKRIEIANQILANPKYEFGRHGPVVLTTEKVITREKEVSRDTIKDVDFSLSGTMTLSGTRETWKYKWDEFKFATPLQHEDGQWYIWWITAKKFASGWERTPIGVWVSGRATQGSLILEENF